MQLLRARTEELHFGAPKIRRIGKREINVVVPAASRSGAALERLGKTAQLTFYDWEANVIGPAGKPAPTAATVTGGADAGAVQYGLLEYQAVRRAASRPAILRAHDTTLDPGCTPAQAHGCSYGSWYLLQPHGEKVLRGPEQTERALYTNEERPVGGPRLEPVRVNPGTVLVRARPVENAAGDVVQSSPNSWFVLNDDPVLTGAEIVDPRQGFEEGARGATEPNVLFNFTKPAQAAFNDLTKQLASRGRQAQLLGAAREAAEQHFAVVLDGQLLTVPSINYAAYPRGISAANGSQIQGAFTLASAQEVARELQEAELPVTLELVSRSSPASR